MSAPQRKKDDPATGSVQVRMLTVNQAAEALQLNYTTTIRMLRDGEIAGIKCGKEWRVPEPEIDALIKHLMERSATVRAAKAASAA